MLPKISLNLKIPNLKKSKEALLLHNKDLPQLGLIVVLVIGVIVGVLLSLQPQIFQKRASEGSLVDIKFVPEKLQVEVGKTYEIKIAINPKGNRVTSSELKIDYNAQSVAIVDIKNEGFLPFTLKSEDTHEGGLDLIYGSTIETNSSEAAVLATIRIRALDTELSSLTIRPDSQITISTQEESVLTNFPSMEIEPAVIGRGSSEKVEYPDNLLLEKAFFADSSPYVQQFRENMEPGPELKPERVKPELSLAYIKQLGGDIFVSPIVALNEVIEEKFGKVIRE